MKKEVYSFPNTVYFINCRSETGGRVLWNLRQNQVISATWKSAYYYYWSTFLTFISVLEGFPPNNFFLSVKREYTLWFLKWSKWENVYSDHSFFIKYRLFKQNVWAFVISSCNFIFQTHKDLEIDLVINSQDTWVRKSSILPHLLCTSILQTQ